MIKLFNGDTASLYIFLICSTLIILLSMCEWLNPKKDFKPIIFSLGIIGTFVGIAYGLYNFQTENIADSIPKLLEGLKTAFFTSIFGMGFATFLGIVETIRGSETDSKKYNDYSEQKNHLLKKLADCEEKNRIYKVTGSLAI